jgi:hypothetical protein
MPDSVDHRVGMFRLAQERRQAGLRSWKRTVNLKGVWRNEAMTFEERRDAIIGRIRESGWQSEDLDNAIDELAEAEDADDFNEVWDLIYDLADEERVWIDLH